MLQKTDRIIAPRGGHRPPLIVRRIDAIPVALPLRSPMKMAGITITKAEIIRRGTELGIDFGLTHSCYDPDVNGQSCGRCDACLLRRKGFAEAGLVDPLPYTN